MILIASSWSGLPNAPNIIAPRHSWLTETPVRPRGRYSMLKLLEPPRVSRGRWVGSDADRRRACPLHCSDNRIACPFGVPMPANQFPAPTRRADAERNRDKILAAAR